MNVQNVSRSSSSLVRSDPKKDDVIIVPVYNVLPVPKRKNTRRCVLNGCTHCSLYGYGDEIKFCIVHKTPGMNKRRGACAYGTCFNNGVYGFPGRKGDWNMFCWKHRLGDTILFCKKKGCLHRADDLQPPFSKFCAFHRFTRYRSLSKNPLDDIEALHIEARPSYEEHREDDEEIFLKKMEDEETTDEE